MWVVAHPLCTNEALHPKYYITRLLVTSCLHAPNFMKIMKYIHYFVVKVYRPAKGVPFTLIM